MCSSDLRHGDRTKDMVLPPIDDLVQSTNVLLERMPTEVEILKQEFKAKKKVNSEKS